MRALCSTGQGIPENQTLSSAFQAGQEGSRAGDRGPGREQDSQARCFPKQEQREGHSSLSPRQSAEPRARRAATASLQKDRRTLEHTGLMAPL